MAQFKSSNSSSTNSMTTGSGDGRSRPASAGKSSSPTPQMVLIELKQRIIVSLNKLADRDTQHIAVEELERVAESLTPEGISLCLSCLYDTDSQQKSAVRKECVRMFGTLASLHEDLLTPHLSKIVINIIKRLRDPDSSVRDACVDAMGTLAAKVSPPNNGGVESTVPAFAGALGVFAKPLFDVLNEQSRSVQVGAAMCLAEVIDNLKEPPPGSLQRLCPRVIKLLNSPTFTAKAALLSVIASIVQAGGTTSYQCLAMVMACVQECLKNNDWATRKAAAETLTSMASTTVSPSLSSFKVSVLEALEACRFDKVKPVRDMVVQTLQVWKRISDPESTGGEKSSSVKENCSESQDTQSSRRKVEGFGESNTKHASQNSSDNEMPEIGCFGFSHPRSAANKIHGDTQKKRVPLTDKKGNPPFFGKTEKKDPTNWQIDIALPRAGGIQDDADAPKKHSKDRKALQEHFGISHSTDHQDYFDGYSGNRDGSQKSNLPHLMLENQIFEESVVMSSTKSRGSVTKHSSCLEASSQLEEVDTGSWSVGAGAISSSSSSIADGQAVNSDNESAFIRRQLCHIESQQSNILELLQKFMSKTEESLTKLETRIAGVESSVANLVTDLSSGKSDANAIRSIKLNSVPDSMTSKVWKRNEVSSFSQDRPLSSEGIPAARGGRSSPLRTQQLGLAINGFSEPRFGTSTQINSWRAQMDAAADSLQRRTEGNTFLSKSLQERGPISSRLGEGPSARSIWQASKDEATLAAIRVAGEDGRIKAPEVLKIGTSTSQSAVELKPELLSHKIGGQGKGPFWSLWSRAADFLRSGDVDSAYVEVLCAGDELLLVRLMSRTGPVLEQLSNGTILELLRSIVQLMLQQSFLDVIVPWLQQVADLVSSNGPDCLGFSLDMKRELITSLEEASTANNPEKWIASTLHELLIQLASSWGLTQAR